jgi:hypothetical protein
VYPGLVLCVTRGGDLIRNIHAHQCICQIANNYVINRLNLCDNAYACSHLVLNRYSAATEAPFSTPIFAKISDITDSAWFISSAPKWPMQPTRKLGATVSFPG